MTKIAGTKESKIIKQATLQAQANFVDGVGKGAGDFWRQEEDLLSGMEAFAAGWFKRRHAVVQAALEASERMCHATTLADCLREYQTWAAGAFERVVADGLAWQHEL